MDWYIRRGIDLAVRKEDGKYEFRHFINQTNAQKENEGVCEDGTDGYGQAPVRAFLHSIPIL